MTTGLLPDGWHLRSLAELVDRIQYGYTASSTRERVGPKFLRITDLTDSGVSWPDVPYCECAQPEKYLLRRGDIVIARTGATTGKSYLLREIPEPTLFASYLIRLATREDPLPEYLAAFMQTGDYWHQISLAKRGNAQPGANASVLGEVQVPVAPLVQQRRIVEKIEALTAKSRRAKEALDTIPPLLERFRQSVLAAAFRGDLTKDWREQNPDVEPADQLLARIRRERRARWEQAELERLRAKGKVPKGDEWKKKYVEPVLVDVAGLPELPDGWCWASLDEITDGSLYGPRFAAGEYSDGGIPTIRTTDMDDTGRICLRDPPRVRVSNDAFMDLGCRDGDLLVTRTGSIGKCAVYDSAIGPALPSAYLIRFRFGGNAALPRFVFRQLQSPRLQTAMGLGTTTTTQPNINARTLGALPIAFPGLAEQMVVADVVERTLGGWDALRAARDAACARLPKLDASILAKAFHGELVDPNNGGDRVRRSK